MNRRSFKSLVLAGVALAATAFAFLPESAQAGQCRTSGRCGSCGTSLRQELVFTGCYDHCGHPVYRWVTLSHHCHGGHHSHGHGHGSSHGSSHRSYGYRSSSSYPRYHSLPSPGFSISINRFSYPVNRYGCR